MKKTTEKMGALQNAFKKGKVLDMQALQAAIGSSAPATIHRYLNGSSTRKTAKSFTSNFLDKICGH